MLWPRARRRENALKLLSSDLVTHGLKPLVRRVAYPAWNRLTTLRYRDLPGYRWPRRPDLVLHGQRGNDYERHRRRVAGYVGGLEGKDVLVFGCGTGKDVPSWLVHRPRRLVGFDYFAYPDEWAALKAAHPGANLDFHRQPEGEATVSPESFDVLASDAVLEHLRDAKGYLVALMRLLKPGGLFYSSFGPTWFGPGGDHLSGYDGLGNVYAHLEKSPADYQAYVEAFSPPALDRPEDDPRLWIRHDLFSRLTLEEYLALFEPCGLEPLFVSYIVDPRALAFRKRHPDRYAALMKSTGRGPEDLDLGGATFIARKVR